MKSLRRKGAGRAGRAGRPDVRVHLDPTFQSAPGSQELLFSASPGNPNTNQPEARPQAYVGWVAKAFSGPAGTLEDPRSWCREPFKKLENQFR